MDTEKIIKIINNSDLPKYQQARWVGFIENAKDEYNKRQEDKLLIEQVANEKKLSQIILSNDEVKIYTVYGDDEWNVKYPYRSIFINSKGVWERSNTVSQNLDLAYLVYLEKKHLGINSQFVAFAIKMLEIKIEE